MSGGLWSPERRSLTLGLVLTITLVAFEALAVSTIMPIVARELGGLDLYGWVFSAFFLGNLLGIVVAGILIDRMRDRTGYELGEDELLEAPHIFIGTIDFLVDKFVRLREQLGISSILLGDVDELAPVVERLAGT